MIQSGNGRSYAEVGHELGLAKSTIQDSVKRTRKRLAAEQLRADAEKLGAPQHLLDDLDDPELLDDPDQIECVADCERLSDLGWHRVRHLPLPDEKLDQYDDELLKVPGFVEHLQNGLRAREILAAWTPSAEFLEAHKPVAADPIKSDPTHSWRKGVVEALARAKGTTYTNPADDEF